MLQANHILRILLLAITACEPLTLLASQDENDFPEQNRNPRLAPSASQDTIESVQPSCQHVIKEMRLIGVEVPHALGPAQPVSASRVHQ